MTSSVVERCRAIATFRYISVRMMETAAAWTPTTPEMEVKVMLGRHIWGFAQMADALGKRTFELRKPIHFTLAPVKAYDVLIDDIAGQIATGSRISALYEGLIPGLTVRYESYVANTDQLLDEPSVEIVHNITQKLERQVSEAASLMRLLGLSSVDSGFAARERAINCFVAIEAVV